MPNTQVKFGYKGDPNTCLWCGRKLRVAFQKREERFVAVDDPEYEKVVAELARVKADYDAYVDSGYTDLGRRRKLRKIGTYKGWQTTRTHGVMGEITGYRLHRYAPDPEQGYGYLGAGHFDTMYCGWQYGLVFAGEGHKLKAKES